MGKLSDEEIRRLRQPSVDELAQSIRDARSFSETEMLDKREFVSDAIGNPKLEEEVERNFYMVLHDRNICNLAGILYHEADLHKGSVDGGVVYFYYRQLNGEEVA